ncbi:hypothetical protein ACFLW2_05255 [Chloroflexota bacterium]
MRKEKGNVMILVLIFLTMCSLAIGTTLSYASSGLKSYQITEEVMMEQYSADAALEDAVWRLKNNIEFPENPGINRESLIPGGTTSVTYPVTINDMDVSVTVELPGDLPDTEPLSHALLQFSLERSDKWIITGDVITYTFTLTNKHPNKILDISEVGASLAPGLEYVSGSSSGMSASDPTITLEQGCQKLLWSLSPPYPLEGKQSATQVFDALASVDGGIYYTSAGANYRAPGLDWEPFDTGPDAPVWVSMYNITVTARKVTLEACAALTQTGGVVDGATIFSWEEQEG